MHSTAFWPNFVTLQTGAVQTGAVQAGAVQAAAKKTKAPRPAAKEPKALQGTPRHPDSHVRWHGDFVC